MRRRALLRPVADIGPFDANNYLTFTALEDGLTVTFSGNICEYAIDGEGPWKSLASGAATPALTKGQNISFRAGLTPSASAAPFGIGTFSPSHTCDVKGNPLSMIYKDNAASATTLPAYAFTELFSGAANIKSAQYLSLPILTLANSCYSSMFKDCSGLTTAPALPATTLADTCYSSMFSGCTSLKTAPTLPALKLVNGCYNRMFSSCSALNYIKVKCNTKLSTSYSYNWVSGVASTGTFSCSATAGHPTGTSGKPSGWTQTGL